MLRAPARWVSLLFFPSAYFFATTNYSYSIFLVFTLHLVVARSEVISVDCSDDCGSKSIIKFSKSIIKFDVHLGGSGRLQTLLHNLCCCLPVVFNDVRIIDEIYNLVERLMGGLGGFALFSKCLPIFCKAVYITVVLSHTIFVTNYFQHS